MEDLKTGEEWLKIYEAKGLHVFNLHGFGEGYMKPVDPSFFTELITEQAFKNGIMFCTISCTKEFAKDFFKLP